jgi:hypothetical protein
MRGGDAKAQSHTTEEHRGFSLRAVFRNVCNRKVKGTTSVVPYRSEKNPGFSPCALCQARGHSLRKITSFEGARLSAVP